MYFRLRPAAFALGLAFAAPAALAQTAAPAPGDWFMQDARTGRYPGASIDRAYAELLTGRRPARTVVVAVIDGGVDVAHPALQGRLWTNPGETPGNGLDDDHNGYVDDVHGWNFLGGPDGRSVNGATYEVTREYARLRGKYEGKTEDQITDRAEFAYFQRVRSEVMEKRAGAQQQLPMVQGLYTAATTGVAKLRAALGLDADAPLADADVDRYAPTTPEGRQAKQVLLQLRGFGITYPELKEYLDQLQGQVAFGYNPDADERSIVGDNPDDLTQRSYGNNDVTGPDATHGTHVAGIIAALRSGFGARGVAESVQIMAVRAVPNGDERDKDVANAIRYAADNGAQIINMSFGKSFSPQKRYVDEAVRYAEGKGVLIVHAAGNSGEDVDTADNFPARGLPPERPRRQLDRGGRERLGRRRQARRRVLQLRRHDGGRVRPRRRHWLDTARRQVRAARRHEHGRARRGGRGGARVELLPEPLGRAGARGGGVVVASLRGPHGYAPGLGGDDPVCAPLGNGRRGGCLRGASEGRAALGRARAVGARCIAPAEIVAAHAAKPGARRAYREASTTEASRFALLPP